ncbi:hypothetical protein [Phenylobacterium sp.]|jgi:hypothetical protein|uniref:hypothetical protein n=1 Tax=Phenylobacterium sp. TaxID=1871053 RepID=UPI00120EE34F|nr:hypothetical protein [Phenylobacterium sp.]THD67130.1 MAG: hypothetical protein E8A12_05510 [Phenylobacterium sp.]
MSMKAMLLAAATAASLAIPAAAMAQDYHHADGRYEARRGRDDRDDRNYRGYGYAPEYGYGYDDSYPAYGYDAYRYAAPVFRDRDDRRWYHDRRDRDHGRR